MKNDVFVQEGIIIPAHELEISTSRSGGAGGQHVNKTDTRITIRWNILTTQALSDEQKQRVMLKLAGRITTEGELIINNSQTRSQDQNRRLALANLAHAIAKALHVAKKRRPTRVSKSAQETRLQEKSQRSNIKKMRSKKFDE